MAGQPSADGIIRPRKHRPSRPVNAVAKWGITLAGPPLPPCGTRSGTWTTVTDERAAGLNGHRRRSHHIMRVAVLSRDYEPLTFCNIERAIALLYLQKAEIIKVTERVMRSISASFPVPAVI